MWLGPIQNSEFAAKVLEGIEGQQAQYKTWARMHGMLSLAKEVRLDCSGQRRDAGLTCTSGIDRPILLHDEQGLRPLQLILCPFDPCCVSVPGRRLPLQC